MLRILRILSCLCLAWMLSHCTAESRVDIAAEADSVRARSEGVSAAEAAFDHDKAMGFWAEDAVAQLVGAPQVQGRDTISKLYKRFLESSGIKAVSSKASEIVVAQSGDLAYETGVNRYTFASTKGDVLDVGKYLLVWKKVGGKWYIAAISASSDAPSPVPINEKSDKSLR
jgi:ketosteroid isomerase-like protein